MAAVSDATPTLQLPGAEPEELVGARVTASFFDVLRIRPTIGRPSQPITKSTDAIGWRC